MKPPPCSHDTVVRIRPAEPVYGTPGVLYARYRCSDCECEWDDPTESPSEGRAVYRVKWGGKNTEVIRNGVRLSGVTSFSVVADTDSPFQHVTLTEHAIVESAT